MHRLKFQEVKLVLFYFQQEQSEVFGVSLEFDHWTLHQLKKASGAWDASELSELYKIKWSLPRKELHRNKFILVNSGWS